MPKDTPAKGEITVHSLDGHTPSVTVPLEEQEDAAYEQRNTVMVEEGTVSTFCDPVNRDEIEDWLSQEFSLDDDDNKPLIEANISQQIWDMKYRFKRPDDTGTVISFDTTPYDTMKRIAWALVQCEAPKERPKLFRRFYKVLKRLFFLPAGRIIAGAGTGRDVTLFNCFVMGAIEDDLSQIFYHLREAALTMQQGGGIGYDFSTLRPKGAPVRGVDADASGPLTFMDVWDMMCRTIMSAGSRRGAMMATMRCDHPDIELFITVKRDPKRLRMFNLSVLVTDAFMHAVENDLPFDLVFGGKVYKTVQARALWDLIMENTYAYAEPGVIFIDRINRALNLRAIESISATNPCGEQPLPPYGACLLGSINLAALVCDAFEDTAYLDLADLREAVQCAVRMMDNVVDVSKFPLPQQEKEARAKRRIGLGVTGVADALVMLKVRYGSDRAVQLLTEWMREVDHTAYRTSIELAKEKGCYPLFNADEVLSEGTHASTLPLDIRIDIQTIGLRNALLTSIAPTGTISLFADNVSSGIEPIFAFEYDRSVLNPDGTRFTETVRTKAVAEFRKRFGEDAPFPDYFVDAQTLTPLEHIRMQGAAQLHVDSSISKTINCPEDMPFEDFKQVYKDAWDHGCKGCTTYRPNEVTGSVLAVKKDEVKPDSTPVPEPEVSVVAQPVESKLTPRPEALPGITYKMKWIHSDHAYYVTICNIEEDGVQRPFEIFINTKDPAHYAWTASLTRMISAIFRRGGDISFVPEELKEVFDPMGGMWVGKRNLKSMQEWLGLTIERHIAETCGPVKTALPGAVLGILEAQGVPVPLAMTEAASGRPPGGKPCPKCHSPDGLHKEQGCEKCIDCGHSKCG